MKVYSVFLFLALLPNLLLADWKAERESLDKVYPVGVFRIFYTLQGEHALPQNNRRDRNGNEVPDYIELIALKLRSADVLFHKTFGLMHPLQSPRYRDEVHYIDVHMLKMKSKGSGGDGIHLFKYEALPLSNAKSLAIKLSTRLRDGSLTPSHELFHLYQNGYTLFKNRWYTEGTARWSEYVQKKGTGSRKSLPSTVEEMEVLLAQTYDTKSLWRQLAYLLDKNSGHFSYPPIANERVPGYPGVIEDNRIYGYNFIKSFLEQLDLMDDIASNAYGLPHYEWREKRQKSELNNVYILCGLKHAIINESMGMEANNELNSFLLLLEKYMDNSCKDKVSAK
ncbi:MAG: hypothetical protein ACKE51_00510 [Methylococcaceae bacterium]